MIGRGYHIALGREHAKELFAIKDDEALRKFLDDLRVRTDMKKSGRVLETGTTWDAVHRCFAEGELDPVGGEFPLNHAVLGGKQLYKGTDSTAVLIRPDMTRFIADALSELDQDSLRPKFFALAGGTPGGGKYDQPVDEKHFMQVWRIVQDLKVFFDAAAENLEAVVFTAKLKQ